MNRIAGDLVTMERALPNARLAILLLAQARVNACAGRHRVKFLPRKADPGPLSAGLAPGAPSDRDLPERAPKRVGGEEPGGQRLSDAQEELDGLGRLRSEERRV